MTPTIEALQAEITRLQQLNADINAAWNSERTGFQFSLSVAAKWRRLEELAEARGIDAESLTPEKIVRYLPDYTRPAGDQVVYNLHQEAKDRA